MKATKCIITEVMFEYIYDLGPYDHSTGRVL